MIEEQMIDLLGSVGFPIFVALYLLWERGRTTKELTRAITELRLVIEKHCFMPKRRRRS